MADRRAKEDDRGSHGTGPAVSSRDSSAMILELLGRGGFVRLAVLA